MTLRTLNIIALAALFVFNLYMSTRLEFPIDGDSGFDGVVARGQVEELPPRVLADGQNLRFSDGEAATRKGVVKLGWCNRSYSGDPMTYPWGTIYGAGVFKDPSSVSWMLFAADGFAYRCRENNAPFALPLPPAVQIVGRAFFAPAFDKVYLFRGRHFNPLVMSSIDEGFKDILPYFNPASTYAVDEEIAYGPFAEIASLTSSGAVARAKTTVPHGYATGADIVIQGATEAEYNGRVPITVIDDVTFTYPFAGSTSPTASGTPECSDMSTYYKCVTGTSAGESPDSAEAKWTQIHNVLPRADDALYVNNRLVVPTWYTPLSGSDGVVTGNAGYTKKDYLIFMDYGDAVHFDFSNEGRINQGSDDEIVGVCKFGDDSLIVFKERSWGLLINIGLDLANMKLDMRNESYGATARAFVAYGDNCYFASGKRGVTNLLQTEQNKVQGVDVPLSDTIQGYINRINWLHADKMRMALWGDKLYVALALDDARVTSANYVDTTVAVTEDHPTMTIATVPGVTYSMTLRDVEYENGNNVIGTSGDFVAVANTVVIHGQSFTYFQSDMRRTFDGVNNAILVYDFQKKLWSGYDNGAALMVKEFFVYNVGGVDRLFFISEDGFINLMEESTSGDQVQGGLYGVRWEEVITSTTTRGYKHNVNGQKKGRSGKIVIATWNPCYTVTQIESGVNKVRTIKANQTKSRTAYYHPFNQPDYVLTNANDDADQPSREDYSVVIPSEGLLLGSGVTLTPFQQTNEDFRAGSLSRYVQFKVTNVSGNLKLKAVEFEAVAGTKRKGTVN